MSEQESHEQEPQEHVLPFEYGGYSFEMKPSNTAAFIHEEEPQYDHLYYTQNGGFQYFFRRMIANFDDVVAYFHKYGYEVNDDNAFATEQDKEQYHEMYGYPEIPTRELTQREEHKLLFARYLLEHEHITPESFNGTGRMA